MKENINVKFKDITLRLIELEDAPRYYEENFTVVDEELNFFTGSDEVFSRQEIYDFVLKSVHHPKHYLFIMVNRQGNIIGEVVLNEFQGKSANFRIAIFKKEDRELGYGSFATKMVCEYARDILGLDQLTLSALECNERAKRTYIKNGFKIVNTLPDSICINGIYYNECVMSNYL